MDGKCFKKLPLNGFKWQRNVSKFDEEFINNYDEDINKVYIIEVDVEYPKDYVICIEIYHSYQKE